MPIVTHVSPLGSEPRDCLHKHSVDRCLGRCAIKGHTFCTVETFEEVAKAVNECGFLTSEMPVILSLEVRRGRANPRPAVPPCHHLPQPS
eukprot:7377240-Prymnesium_polylepis.1